MECCFSKLLHIRVTWGTFKTPRARAADIKSEALELNLKTLQVITMWFENLGGEKPLRGRKEVMGGWDRGTGQRQLMEGVLIPGVLLLVCECLVFLWSFIYWGQVWRGPFTPDFSVTAAT